MSKVLGISQYYCLDVISKKRQFRILSSTPRNPIPLKDYDKEIIDWIWDNFSLDDNAIILVNAGYQKLQTNNRSPFAELIEWDVVVQYLNKNNFSKMLIFHFDVFVFSLSQEDQEKINNSNLVRYKFDQREHMSENFVFTKFPEYAICPEIETTKYICENTKIPYEIYHCEYNANSVAEKYNLKIKYFDYFTARFSDLRWQHLSFINEYQKLNYKICCFNHRKTYHRHYTCSFLSQQDDVFFSIYSIYNDQELYNNILSLDLFTEKYQNIFLAGNELLKSNDFRWDLHTSNDYRHKKLSQEKYGDNWYTVINPDNDLQAQTSYKIRESFLTLLTETKFISPWPNFSEKTIRCFCSYRPFLLLAPPRTLRLLKDLGFKTFDRWWDESYDEIENHHRRLEKVLDTCENILSKNFNELEKLLEEMKEVLDHNYQNLCNLKKRMLEYSKLSS
jgi:hypothetical protein